jgi:hypothetical protein
VLLLLLGNPSVAGFKSAAAPIPMIKFKRTKILLAYKLNGNKAGKLWFAT